MPPTEPLPEPDRTALTVFRQDPKKTTIITSGEVEKGWIPPPLKTYGEGDVLLDHYRVERILSGAMGHVYIAHHEPWDLKFAVKAPNERVLRNPQLFANVIREAAFQ